MVLTWLWPNTNSCLALRCNRSTFDPIWVIHLILCLLKRLQSVCLVYRTNSIWASRIFGVHCLESLLLVITKRIFDVRFSHCVHEVRLTIWGGTRIKIQLRSEYGMITRGNMSYLLIILSIDCNSTRRDILGSIIIIWLVLVFEGISCISIRYQFGRGQIPHFLFVNELELKSAWLSLFET